jgi:acyl carrier protein
MGKITEKEILDFISVTLNYEYLVHQTEIELESKIKDLEIDSIDFIEFIMLIEDKYNISIDEDTSKGFKTIGEIVQYINKQI